MRLEIKIVTFSSPENDTKEIDAQKLVCDGEPEVLQRLDIGKALLPLIQYMLEEARQPQNR